MEENLESVQAANLKNLHVVLTTVKSKIISPVVEHIKSKERLNEIAKTESLKMNNTILEWILASGFHKSFDVKSGIQKLDEYESTEGFFGDLAEVNLVAEKAPLPPPDMTLYSDYKINFAEDFQLDWS